MRQACLGKGRNPAPNFEQAIRAKDEYVMHSTHSNKLSIQLLRTLCFGNKGEHISQCKTVTANMAHTAFEETRYYSHSEDIQVISNRSGHLHPARNLTYGKYKKTSYSLPRQHDVADLPSARKGSSATESRLIDSPITDIAPKLSTTPQEVQSNTHAHRAKLSVRLPRPTTRPSPSTPRAFSPRGNQRRSARRPANRPLRRGRFRRNLILAIKL